MALMRLSDGLGNQLFQFAASRALTARGVPVSFLLDAFESANARTDRPLLLPQLIAGDLDVVDGAAPRALVGRSIYKLFERQRRYPSVHIAHVCHLSRLPDYDPRFAAIDRGMVVSGYFQSLKYFSDAQAAVRSAILQKCQAQMAARRGRLRAETGAQALAAVHVRRGDYLRIGANQSKLVPLDRIKAAVQALQSAVDPARKLGFVVFSDDVDYARTIDLGRDVHVNRSDNDVDEFMAMAACDHFIIANSTYSWWASWVGEAPDKLIFAPRNWARPGGAATDESRDIYLAEHRLY